MKYGNLILVALYLILSAGCSYSFRVTESFEPEPGGIAPNEGALPGLLPVQGDLPGTPTGDKYERVGLVTASGGEITVHGNNSDNGIKLIGRDLDPGESPRGMIITFDSACIHKSNTGFCLSGAGYPTVDFGVRDEQGNFGLTFTISGGNVYIPDVGSITEFEFPAGGTVEFHGGTVHRVTIRMNFETRQGALTVSQAWSETLRLDKTLNFVVPREFGIAKSLEVLSHGFAYNPGQGHRIIKPVATYHNAE